MSGNFSSWKFGDVVPSLDHSSTDYSFSEAVQAQYEKLCNDSENVPQLVARMVLQVVDRAVDLHVDRVFADSRKAHPEATKMSALEKGKRRSAERKRKRQDLEAIEESEPEEEGVQSEEEEEQSEEEEDQEEQEEEVAKRKVEVDELNLVRSNKAWETTLPQFEEKSDYCGPKYLKRNTAEHNFSQRCRYVACAYILRNYIEADMNVTHESWKSAIDNSKQDDGVLFTSRLECYPNTGFPIWQAKANFIHRVLWKSYKKLMENGKQDYWDNYLQIAKCIKESYEYDTGKG